MLFFITMNDNKFTIELYLDVIRNAIDFPAKILSYEEAYRTPSFRGAVVIFCDIERFPLEQLSIPRNLYNRIAGEQPRAILNNPWTVLQRFDLLKTLKQAGINSFDIHRPPLHGKLIRFPVFLRNELDHYGPVSDLIHTETALHTQLRTAKGKKPGPFSPVVVEYCDARSQDGRYHKYGAFYLRDTIVPRHLFFSNNWMVKGTADQLPQDLAMEMDYINNNHFASELAAVFKLAQIDYGRVDFVATPRGIEVFEINTNPTMLDAGDMKSNRKQVTDYFLTNFTKAVKLLHG